MFWPFLCTRLDDFEYVNVCIRKSKGLGMLSQLIMCYICTLLFSFSLIFSFVTCNKGPKLAQETIPLQFSF